MALELEAVVPTFVEFVAVLAFPVNAPTKVVDVIVPVEVL